MLEKPETLKEAIKILKDSATDDFSAKYKKTFRLRACLIAATGLAVAAAAGAITRNATWTLALLPAVVLISFVGVMPLLTFNSRLRSYKNGKFFAKNKEQYIMDVASTYVEEYNAFQRHQEEKNK